MMIYQFLVWYLLGMASMLFLIHVSSWTYVRFSSESTSRLKTWAQARHDRLESIIRRRTNGTGSHP